MHVGSEWLCAYAQTDVHNASSLDVVHVVNFGGCTQRAETARGCDACMLQCMSLCMRLACCMQVVHPELIGVGDGFILVDKSLPVLKRSSCIQACDPDPVISRRNINMTAIWTQRRRHKVVRGSDGANVDLVPGAPCCQ